jgi:hypothetical protein
VNDGEQKKALETLDVAWARAQIPDPPPFPIREEALLIGMHKARYEFAGIARELRLASGEWLRARGYGRRVGPLLPPGELP